MANTNLRKYAGSITDEDSGIGLDYASSSDLNSSRSTLIEPPRSTRSTTYSSHPINPSSSTVRVFSDGIIERVRPATMKNSENGEFIICRTNRGTFVARRTPIVPQWVTDLVREIESQQR